MFDSRPRSCRFKPHQYFVSLLVIQSSHSAGDIWLLCFYCFNDAMWLLLCLSTSLPWADCGISRSYSVTLVIQSSHSAGDIWLLCFYCFNDAMWLLLCLSTSLPWADCGISRSYSVTLCTIYVVKTKLLINKGTVPTNLICAFDSAHTGMQKQVNHD